MLYEHSRLCSTAVCPTESRPCSSDDCTAVVTTLLTAGALANRFSAVTIYSVDTIYSIYVPGTFAEQQCTEGSRGMVHLLLMSVRRATAWLPVVFGRYGPADAGASHSNGITGPDVQIVCHADLLRVIGNEHDT